MKDVPFFDLHIDVTFGSIQNAELFSKLIMNEGDNQLLFTKCYSI